MLIRIVKLTLKPEHAAAFIAVASKHQSLIRAFEGCHHQEMLQVDDTPNTFLTYSKWDDANALNNYRNSTLFNSIWTTIKPWFAQKAEAWSTTEL